MPPAAWYNALLNNTALTSIIFDCLNLRYFKFYCGHQNHMKVRRVYPLFGKLMHLLILQSIVSISSEARALGDPTDARSSLMGFAWALIDYNKDWNTILPISWIINPSMFENTISERSALLFDTAWQYCYCIFWSHCRNYVFPQYFCLVFQCKRLKIIHSRSNMI